ncbi:hypothetical protein RB620_04725 [Paenibacillus sp. LHD-117]|uniref:hypothetical protein n=1 Tax=Paenibacillus sp. LHD-117 TaxID=3071412 RepID=UPI0027DEBCCE|nr:hypothetical protein [Paenibacillus sp. LHD-117]MDQ6418738.1 hypothetical protein [Paenibacillus sp. LHD-117]
MLAKRLAEMDGMFGGLLPWLAGQYDPVSGGFYYARSSREQAGRRPDIESTAQALNMLERLGLIETMPDAMRRRMIAFFQAKQDSSTGYFYDEDPAMREDEVMVSRAIGYSANALRKLGGTPLYGLPRESAPAYMASVESYRQWLASVELSNSWRGCDRLSCSHVYVGELAEPDRSRYAAAAFDFFEEAQDRVTGLWGEGSLYVRISGTFKLHLFYGGFGRPMPREKEMYGSILKALADEVAGDMCYIRNPVHLLSYVRPAMTNEELAFVLRRTLHNMGKLLRADGGFSRELSHSPSAPNVAQVKDGETYPGMPYPVHLSEGRVEGDMNAATQALLIRTLCRQLAGAEADWLEGVTREQLDSFYEDAVERER